MAALTAIERLAMFEVGWQENSYLSRKSCRWQSFSLSFRGEIDLLGGYAA
jgi:hypothetical protein